MKTKILLLLFLFAGLGVNRLSAQNNRDVYDWPVPESVVNLDVYCDGQLVDQVQNLEAFTLKCRDKYKDGVSAAWNQHLNNVSFISLLTGELFKFQGHEKGTWNPVNGIGESRSIMIGNCGSHYIMTIFYELNPETWELTVIEIRSVCH